MLSAATLMAAGPIPTVGPTSVPTAGPTIAPTPVLTNAAPICYPQPAANKLTFAYKLNSAGSSAKIYVYNLSGAQVADFDGTAYAGTNIVYVPDISKMAPGIYFYVIRIVEADGSVTKLKLSKFVVGR
jgi:methionine-rich copper-binding protein CopC